MDNSYNYLSLQSKAALAKGFGDKVNPIFRDIEIGFFSDGLLISMPVSHKGRIFNIATTCNKLLSIGFLCRGAIIRGYCYHRENRVFGPAINEVIKLEKEAIFPRILCTSEVIEIAHGSDKNCIFITTDFFGRKVLNLFNPPVMVTSDSKLFVENCLSVREIENKIQTRIQQYQHSEEGKILEKWRYAQLLMEIQLKESVYGKLNRRKWSKILSRFFFQD